jgi:hypothetical protein
MNPSIQKFIASLIVVLLAVFATSSTLFASTWPCAIPNCPTSCGDGSGGFQADTVNINRTYLGYRGSPSTEAMAGQSRPKLIQRNGDSRNKSANALSITYDDFLNHLVPGLDRLGQILIDPAGIPMDVGGEDVEDVTWNMPDFTLQGTLQLRNTFSEEVNSTPFTGDFPEANITHAFQTGAYYEYYEVIPDMQEETGAVYYYGASDESFIYPGDLVHAPVPLSLGLGLFEAEFGAVDCALLEGGCGTGNPAEAYYLMTQEFEEVATGTLNTYDNGPTQAIKVRNSHIERVYDADDNLLEENLTDYLIWYSKDGHYMRAELADGAPWVGNTNFVQIEYQKLSSGSLPVQWREVTAEVKKDREVEVRWSTETETNSERFIVERSVDGTNYQQLSSVPAAGDTNLPQEYRFLDEGAQEGFNYYRIKQLDFSGQSTYSSVVSALVTMLRDGEALTVLYPNPGRDEVYFSRPASYELFGVQGQRLSSGVVEGSLDVSGLPAGQYLVRLDGGKLHRWVKQ